ncbi:MAG TPA: hypothetical protein VEC99_12575, partial [Clostridia bacterium]|nr:hypothetical protein [Clostridia bacterium]
MNGHPFPSSVERALFKLRTGSYNFERPGDASLFLGPIRPLLKTDERIRALFINRIVGGVDTLYQQFYMDQRELLDALLEELPDSAQARFLLNYIAFQHMGEDGLYTKNAHRIMAKRFAHDPWFRRQVEQNAGGRGMGFSWQYFPEEISDYDRKLILDWALEEARYLPMCLGMGDAAFVLARNPQFSLEEFDLSDQACRIYQVARSGADYAARLRALAGCAELGWQGQCKAVELLACDLTAENVEALCAIAETGSPPFWGTARACLARHASQSPRIHQWLREQASSPNANSWWLLTLAENADAQDIAQEAFCRLLDQPDLISSSWGMLNSARRLFLEPWRIPASEGIPLMERLLARGDVPLREEFLDVLVEAYPEHSQTRAILTRCKCAPGLRRLDGLTPPVVSLALELARSGQFSEGVASILCDAHSDEPFRTLLEIAQNATDKPAAVRALKYLVDGYAERMEVKELLIRFGQDNEMDASIQGGALCALAFHFREAPETAEILVHLGTTQPHNELVRELFEYVHDPDYDSWCGPRLQWKRQFENLLRQQDVENWWDCARGAFGLALWFGETEETFSLLEDLILSEPPPVIDAPSAFSPERYYSERRHKLHRQLAPACLRITVMRWREHPRVLQLLHTALEHKLAEVRETAAILLAQAFSTNPSTIAVLRVRLRESSRIFSEYMLLRMGDTEAMAEGLAALVNLP